MNKTILIGGLILALGLTVFLLSRTTGDRRDTNAVETSLLGHWAATNGDEIFYSPDMAVAVTKDGTRSYHPYRVLMSNEAQSWLKILIQNMEGEPVARVLRFAENRRSYATFIPVLTAEGRTLREATLLYVDDRQAP